MKRSARGNRFMWDAKATQIFLDLWLESIRELRTATSNALLHKAIASRMTKYRATRTEIKTKIDNMKKKYRIELVRSEKSKVPSTWQYFQQVEQILIEFKSHSMSFREDFEFSSLDDSDSATDSEFWSKFDNEKSQMETDAKKSKEQTKSMERMIENSVENDSNHSTNTQETLNELMPAKSDEIVAIAEAKLAIQKEQLKVMKNVADELSFMHREFLKAYRNS